MKPWMMFAFSAALFWGAYVPAISYGQAAFGGRTNPNSSMRAFLFIGLAYFIMAIIIPGVWLMTHEVPGDAFNLRGGVLSTLAGALGALGALGVVFALKYGGGNAMFVAPIVFAGAPIVNVLIAYLIGYITDPANAHAPHPMFFVGLLLAVAGTATVLIYSPAAPHAPPPTTAATSGSGPATGAATKPASEGNAH